MNKSETIADLAAALSKAQAKIEGAVKDKGNPAFRSKYADLGAVWDAVREPLSSNGLSVVQFPRTLDGFVEVETILIHSSGQFLSDVFAIPVSKRDAHGYMSACTYARRGGLMAVAGVAPVDDDANAAVGKGALMQDPIALAKAEIAAEHGDRPSQYEVDKAKKAVSVGVAEAARGALRPDDAGPVPPFLKRPVAGSPTDRISKAQAWLSTSLDAVRKLPTERAIGDWWDTNEAAIGKLQNEYPALYDRLVTAVDERRDSVPPMMAAG